MKTRVRKTEIFKFRCEEWLKVEANKIAERQDLDASDIGRMALKKFVAEFSQPANPTLLMNG